MWHITFEDRLHREDDVTIAMAERIEDLVGESWLYLVPLRSAKHAAAILTVMHAAATGETEDAVAARVRALRVSDYLAGMTTAVADDLPTMYVDGNPPKADEG